MFSAWKKRRALRRIARRLPRDLARRFGTTDVYTADQVRTALREGRYDQRYWGYALAMCLVADEAAAVLGGHDEVTGMRGEMAERFFHGDMDFTLDTARLDAGSGSFHGDFGGGGGGFSDGGGDGGSL